MWSPTKEKRDRPKQRDQARNHRSVIQLIDQPMRQVVGRWHHNDACWFVEVKVIMQVGVFTWGPSLGCNGNECCLHARMQSWDWLFPFCAWAGLNKCVCSYMWWIVRMAGGTFWLCTVSVGKASSHCVCMRLSVVHHKPSVAYILNVTGSIHPPTKAKSNTVGGTFRFNGYLVFTWCRQITLGKESLRYFKLLVVKATTYSSH